MSAKPQVAADGAGLKLPARVIPVPTTISAEAQRFLATPRPPFPEWPELHDTAAWHEAVAKTNAIFAPIHEEHRRQFTGSLDKRQLSGVSIYEAVPAAMPARNRDRVLLFLHGGAYVFGGGSLAGTGALPVAGAGGYRTYSPDYRMPPDHPFPAALDDAVATYRELLKSTPPRRIGFVGLSAGGGLAAATILKARDVGLPLPGAAVLLTPEADLTESGDTFATNEVLDIVLQKPMMRLNQLYAAGADLRNPYLSPVYGDFSKGFCPTFMQSGTRDLLLSNTVILHRALRRARIEVELHVWEAMPHAGFFGASEDAEMLAEQLRFLDRHLG
ncbi:MAG: alpha/beta hydrolase [Steroidobacteraceae bacterium]